MIKFKDDDWNIQKLKNRTNKGVHSHTISPSCEVGNQQMLRLLEQEQSTEEPMPDGFTEKMEADYGIGLKSIKLQRNTEPSILKQRAYARGNEIHIASGFSADTGDGRRILSHEMAHIIQQGNKGFGGRTDADAEHQAHEGAVKPGPGFLLPSGTAGYPAQGIDTFEIEDEEIELQLFQPVRLLIEQFNVIAEQEAELTPESRQELFRLLDGIDTAIYQLMNQGIDQEDMIYFQNIEGFNAMENILEKSRKLYEELTKQTMDNRQLDNEGLVTELPVSLEGRSQEEIRELKEIWTRITAPTSNITVGNEAAPANPDFKKQIYGYIGKMLHYRTGAKLLRGAETGEKKIMVTESGGAAVDAAPPGGSFDQIPGGQPPEVSRYENPEQFEADFWNLLIRIGPESDTFSIGDKIYRKGAGSHAAVSMTLNQPQSTLDTGRDGKQAQYSPWMIFAHELGHAVKRTHGMDFSNSNSTIYTDHQLNDFTPGTKNPEEYANNRLVENPLRRESGMRERTKYGGLESKPIRDFCTSLRYGIPDPALQNHYQSLNSLVCDEVITQSNPELAELKEILDSKVTLQSLFIHNVRILEELRQQLRDLPFINEDGTINAEQVTAVKDPAAEEIWNQIEERGMESCTWIIIKYFKRRSFDHAKNNCMAAGASLQPLRDMV